MTEIQEMAQAIYEKHKALWPLTWAVADFMAKQLAGDQGYLIINQLTHALMGLNTKQADAFTATDMINQPAEAEGVEVVAMFVYDNDMLLCVEFDPKERMGTADGTALVLQSDHLAALSAVTADRDALAARLGEWERSTLARIMRENVELTAERDRLREDRDDCAEARVHYAGKLGEVMAERDQIRAELDELRKDAERFCHIERDCDSGMRGIYGDDWVEVIDGYIAEYAAMAAKEASDEPS